MAGYVIANGARNSLPCGLVLLRWTQTEQSAEIFHSPQRLPFIVHIKAVDDKSIAVTRHLGFCAGKHLAQHLHAQEADELWLFFNAFIDRFKCEDWSITKAQNTFWKGRRGEFSGKIKYGDSRVRDLYGNTASFASGGENKN